MADALPIVKTELTESVINTEAIPVVSEDITLDTSPRGGDDDMLEGTEIKTGNIEADWSDSESEGDEETIQFQTSTSSNEPSHHRRYDKGATTYVRPEMSKLGKDGGDDGVTPSAESDDLKKMRFSYHRTAFDVDIDELDEHPWRMSHVDISDFFNYGFSEPTWRRYCEKQLRIRVSKGEGPSVQPDTSSTVTTPATSAAAAAASFLSGLQQQQQTIVPPAPSLPPFPVVATHAQHSPIPPPHHNQQQHGLPSPQMDTYSRGDDSYYGGGDRPPNKRHRY